MPGVGAAMSRPRGGRHGDKRRREDSLVDVQAANRAWWEANPMTYDWRAAGGPPPGSAPWFADQDARADRQHAGFLAGGDPVGHLLGDVPLAGRDVLEIGVGSGYHAELLRRRGAHVTGIDLTAPAVELSRARFTQRGLDGEFEVWDAEVDRPDFAGRFDAVWSWGVIHHSAHTARIVRNVHRWLRPDGVFAGMVYHRDSSRLAVALVRDWLLDANWRTHSVDEALWRNTDGFTARFYPADQWRDLLLAFFEEAQTSVGGLDVDVVPLPAPWRRLVWARMEATARERRLRRAGHFLLFTARSVRAP